MKTNHKEEISNSQTVSVAATIESLIPKIAIPDNLSLSETIKILFQKQKRIIANSVVYEKLSHGITEEIKCVFIETNELGEEDVMSDSELELLEAMELYEWLNNKKYVLSNFNKKQN